MQKVLDRAPTQTAFGLRIQAETFRQAGRLAKAAEDLARLFSQSNDEVRKLASGVPDVEPVLAAMELAGITPPEPPVAARLANLAA